MIFKLYSKDTAELLLKPETGMGYQIIEAKIYGSNLNQVFCIYNGQVAIDLDRDFNVNKNYLFTEHITKVFETSNFLQIQTSSINVLSKQNAIQLTENLKLQKISMSEIERTKKQRNKGGKGAKDNPKRYANGVEKFVRLSAYEDDKRIDFDNKKLKDGSYTTTEYDYKLCYSTSDDPVDRYALPNDEKIKWAFYIQPKTYDSLQEGIVQPAFGHNGGGIEDFFEKGTSINTYLEKREYGK